MIIERNGKFYKQTIVEEEIDIESEEKKLQAWKDAIDIDNAEIQATLEKRQEIESLDISDDYKQKLLDNVTFFSGSGITQERLNEQQKIVDEINAIKSKK